MVSLDAGVRKAPCAARNTFTTKAPREIAAALPLTAAPRAVCFKRLRATAAESAAANA